MSSYRPSSYYYRQILRTGTEAELRAALEEVVDDREQLRAWVREQGMIPPVFRVPAGKADDIIRHPATAWQRDVSGRF